MIPFFTLKRQNNELRNELDVCIKKVIKKGIFVLGENVAEFEKEFAKYIGTKHAVAVASGTDALALSLMAVGIKAGDEVIVPANSYPTAFAISSVGAIPKLVNIDPFSYNIDPKKISQTIGRKTKAIIPVHLYGQPASMKPILEISKKHNLIVVEDCCQAHGAEIRIKNYELRIKNKKIHQPPTTNHQSLSYFSKKVGSLGDVGCFSFYPTKNLGCFGDGGMVVTNNKDITKKMKLLRMYGEKNRYQSILLGRNSRLDELQAAILLLKLKYLDKWNDKRRKLAEKYKYELQKSLLGKLIQLPSESPNLKHIYHLFVIQVEKRDILRKYLEENGVGSAIHYPKAIHQQASFDFLGYKKGSFPICEKASKRILSLPMFPELKESEVERISKLILEFLRKNHD